MQKAVGLGWRRRCSVLLYIAIWSLGVCGSRVEALPAVCAAAWLCCRSRMTLSLMQCWLKAGRKRLRAKAVLREQVAIDLRFPVFLHR